MKLHWSPRSPFVRKVMITLHETDLLRHVELERSVVAANLPPNPAVLKDNPLGKIPALITDDGLAIFDSRVICEYLDAMAGTGLFPTGWQPRLLHLRWQALADGLTDILLLWRNELAREGQVSPALCASFLTKVRTCMDRLDAEAPELAAAPFGIGHIALLAALGQLDFRWPDCDWRAAFPALAQAVEPHFRRPSVRATAIVDDQAGQTPDITRGALFFPETSR